MKKTDLSKKVSCKKLRKSITAALLAALAAGSLSFGVSAESEIHYISVKSEKTEAGSNYGNDGAKGGDSMVIGIGSTSEGENSTVIGNNNTLKPLRKGGKDNIVAGQNLEVHGGQNTVIGTNSQNNRRYKETKVAGLRNTVIGTANLVGYTAKQDPTDRNKWIYTMENGGKGDDENVVVGLNNTSNGGGIVIGTNSEVTSKGTSVGNNNKIISDYDYGLALGNGLTVDGEKAVAIGSESRATADYATAIGHESIAKKENSIAFGYEAEATEKGAVALGARSKATTGKGIWGVDASENKIMDLDDVLGDKKAEYLEAVEKYKSLRAEASALAKAVDESYEADSPDYTDLQEKWEAKKKESNAQLRVVKNYTKAWKSGEAAVSVGDADNGITRQITGVAAGTKDTDAVNMAQLKKINRKIDKNAVHYYSVKSDKQAAGSNFANDGAKAADSMVIGISSTSEGINSTVIGNNNKLTGNTSFIGDDGKAVKVNNSIVAGQNLEVDGYSNTVFATESVYDMYQRKTKVAGDHNTVIGAGNLVGYSEEDDRTYTKLGQGISSNKNVVIGTRQTVSGSNNVAVGYLTEFEVGADQITTMGIQNHIGSEAQEGIAIGNHLEINGPQSLAIGFQSGADAKSAIAFGSNSFANAESAIAFGSNNSANAKSSVAIGESSEADVEGGVALGSGSMANREAGMAGYLSEGKTSAEWKSTLGALSVGAEFDKGADTRQITGVAAGTKDTDAVNVAQLKAVAKNLTGNITQTNCTIVESDTIAVEKTEKEDKSTEYKLNVKTNGKVEKGNKGIVTGGTVYKETRIEKDGNYIKKNNTAGENLIALDKQVGINTGNIHKNTETINILGKQVGNLDTKVNRVGAGAAALAGLHPLDYDPDNKFDFAAGYGNYKGANAAAIGAYYRPNEDTMFSIGGSFGGGENMVSAGVSVKLGQGTGISTSKVAMAKEISELKEENREMKQEIEVLKEQMQKLLAGK